MTDAWKAILASRKFWTALAAVAACIVVVAGADPDKWTPLISAIVTLATVVIAATGYEDGQEKSNPANPSLAAPARANSQPPASGDSQASVAKTIVTTIGKPNPNLILLLLSATIIFIAGGCAVDPASRVAQARDALTRTQDAIVAQHAAGTISDQQLLAFDPLIQGARQALVLAQDQVDHGLSGQQLDYYLSVAQSVIEKLAAEIPADQPPTSNQQPTTNNR